jgi:hypothetical protein
LDRVGSAEIEASHPPDAFHLRPYKTNSSAPEPENELLIGVPWLRFRPVGPLA